MIMVNLESNAGSWDLDGLDVGDWEVGQVDDVLLTSLLQVATGVAAVTWHASVADLLGGGLLGFRSTTALGDWLNGEADTKILTVLRFLRFLLFVFVVVLGLFSLLLSVPLVSVVLLLGKTIVLNLALLKLIKCSELFTSRIYYLVLEKVRAVELLNIFSLVVVGGHELVVIVSVVVSAKSAKLALGGNRLEVGLDGVSVETDLSFWKADDDELGLLDLLSVNLDEELIIGLLDKDFFLTANNLDHELFGVLVHLLGKNGESWLLSAVLGDKREAGGEWGIVDDVVEGGNFRLVDLAGSSGLFPDLLDHGTAGNSWENDAWDTDILDLNLLLWSLDGHVDVLAGEWLNGELEGHTALLILNTLLRNSPEVVGLDEVEETGEGVLSFLGKLVLGDNVDLVKTGSLDQELVLWDSVELTLNVADVLLLFLGLFKLSSDGHLALLGRSPLGVKGELNLTVWLLTELAEGRWHLWAGSKKFGTESPFLVLMSKWGTAAVHLDLAHTDPLVANSAEFGVPVGLLWSLKLEGDEVLVSLLRLDLTDHLVEVLAAVLGFVVLNIEFLLEDLVELDLGKVSLLEVSNGETGNKLSWAVLVLKGVLEILLGHEDLWKGPLGKKVSLGVDLESEDFVLAVDLFGGHLVLGVEDGLLFGFWESVVLWNAEESDWAGIEGDGGLLVLWDNKLVGDFESVLLHLNNGFESHWRVDTDGLKRSNSLVEHWVPEAHLGDGETGSELLHLNGDLSGEGKDGWHLSGDSEGNSAGGWDSTDGFEEVEGTMKFEFGVLVQERENRLDVEFSISDVLLEKVVKGFHIEWENDVVHLLVAEVENGMGGLVISTLDTWADVHLLDDLLEHLDSGLDTTGTELIRLLSVAGESLETLDDDLFEVLLGESNLSEVLVPVTSKDRLERGLDLLWQESVLLEDGSEVELNSGEPLRLEQWKLSVGGENLFLWLVTGEEKNLGATDSQGLVAWVGGSGELADDVVGEGSNVLVGFLLHLGDDVSKDWLLWKSVHHSEESGHTELWLVLTVLVDWEEDLLDLAWHGVLEKTESINGLSADSKWLTWILDELNEFVDGKVESSVSEGLEGKDLLVGGFSGTEELHEDADVLLLELAGGWAGQLEVLGLGSESTDDGSGGEPGGLAEWLTVLSDWGLGKLNDEVGDLLAWSDGLLDGLEKLNSSEWGNGHLAEVIIEYLVFGLDVELSVDLLKLGKSAHTEKADSASNELNGFWSVLLKFLNLTEDLFDLFNLLLGWNNLKWVDLSAISLLAETFHEHLVSRGEDDVSLWSDIYLYLLDFLVDLVLLNEDDLGASLRLDDLLSVDIQSVDGVDFGLFQLLVLEGVGVDSLWLHELSLLLALLALRSESESVSHLWAGDALVEVDRFGVDGFLSFLNNSVGDFAISFHGLLVDIEEKGVLLGSHISLLSVHLVNWGRLVKGKKVDDDSLGVHGPLSIFSRELDLRDESVSDLGAEWKLKELSVLVGELTLLQRLHLWHLLGLWGMGSGVGDIDQLEVDVAVINSLNAGTAGNTGLGSIRRGGWESREKKSVKLVDVLALWREGAVESRGGGNRQGDKRGNDDRLHCESDYSSSRHPFYTRR